MGQCGNDATNFTIGEVSDGYLVVAEVDAAEVEAVGQVESGSSHCSGALTIKLSSGGRAESQ
jgi:uncharacterized protein YdbL (DUF1318 family)